MSASPDPAGAARRPRPARHRAPARVEPVVASPEGELRRMIGLSGDGSIEELRAAYDLAVHRATRAGDHQHALTLSRAYDRLPVTTRDRLYPSSRRAAGGSVSTRPAGRTRPTFARPVRRRPGRRRGGWARVLAYGLFASVGIGGCVYLATHARPPSDAPSPVVLQTPTADPSTTGLPVAGLQTASRLNSGPRPVIVPVDAPTGANGLVTLMCRSGSGDYLMTAPRGAVVECSNGAVPAVLG